MFEVILIKGVLENLTNKIKKTGKYENKLGTLVTSIEGRITMESMKSNIKPRKTLDFVSARLVREKNVKYAPTITCPEDAIECIRDFLSGWDRECFGILNIAISGKVLNTSIVSIGTLSEAPVHPREVFKPAILASANAIILYHTHPSGNATPSDEDYRTTDRMCRAGKMLGIQVLDHVILTDTEMYSMREQREMPDISGFEI